MDRSARRVTRKPDITPGRGERAPVSQAVTGELDSPVAELPRREGLPFRAALDLAELDERGRPGTTWTGRACELSRSHLVFRSRRMCYPGRLVVLAVHLVDDSPVALCGQVVECEYDGVGLHRTRMNLLRMPDSEPVNDWVELREARGTL
jgi:hypothetical protein